MNNEVSELHINTNWGFEHNNIVCSGNVEGINIKGITNYKIEDSYIPNSIFNKIEFKNYEFSLRQRDSRDKFYIIFEDNDLIDFLFSYVKMNDLEDKYKNALQFKELNTKITLQEEFKAKIKELYFFENMIAGVLNIEGKQKKRLLKNINKIANTNFVLDRNENFPDIKHVSLNRTTMWILRFD